MNNESPPVLHQNGPDRNVLVFWEDTKPNGLNPGQFNSLLMVRVSVPGDNKSSAEYWVEEKFPKEYPHPIHKAERRNEEIYKRFQSSIEQYKKNTLSDLQAGTPLEAWPMVHRAQIALLKHNGVHSVEALAGLTDQHITQIGMEGRALVQKAKDYLESATNSKAAMEALERERKLEARFASLEERYTALAEALAELPEDRQNEIKAKLGRGRHKDAA